MQKNSRKRIAATLSPLLPLLLAAAGCTSIDSHVRIADWPELRIVEHRVPYREMYERCAKYTGLFMTPLGCTEFHFASGEAHIYVTPGVAMQSVLKHERLHAAGYDHLGSSHMDELWHRWRSSHPMATAQAVIAPGGGVAASELLP